MLPIEYLLTAREILILMVMIREQSSNEATNLTSTEDNVNAPSLPIQSSTSAINSILSTNGAELDPQLQNWTFQPSFELSPPLSVEQISPLFIPSLQVISADQTAPTF